METIRRDDPSALGNLPAILALLIPIAAIGGWFAYRSVEQWQGVEEQCRAMQVTLGAAFEARSIARPRNEAQRGYLLPAGMAGIIARGRELP